MEKQKLDKGHWISPWEFEPDEFVGFIYRITNEITGQQYIGKKFLHSTLRKKVKNKTRRKKTITESNWKKYSGSSKWLLSDIEKYGKENFKFQIEALCESRSNLAWLEVEKLVKENVLREKLPNGEPKYYNGLIPQIRYKILDETPKEKKYKLT
jgi:hypothetical protein